ncbi:hypothetical protein [Mycoplasmopsis cricetuli]|uniref:hypothetical protein n=1 Tax=Mycoplasmopsis cricetuli TaxID=171283 RepID=UPI00046F7A2B|nr:hypothetical protein [Mycoplasmopsis cricetuli]
MAQQVLARCEICNYEFKYIFGIPRELFFVEMFLESWKKEQKNLFDFQNFKNTFEGQVNLAIQMNDQLNKEEILTKNFKFIKSFFNSEEKELLINNFLLEYELEIYPVILKNELNFSTRKIYQIPLFEFNFFKYGKYKRVYKNVLYIQFNSEQTYLTCPNDLKLSCKKISEQNI